ncbi:M14 family metallopeptidase [Seonamhaeicola sp.]|uniref:succinylglutamate desuccinylase/aspartoacylase family protein n=1 Tax=Seonamhaeicola sp. TaxID=1912245 RepID=UPI0026187A79|nr:M14 family metallopeptidase [Seonamhaeicola sp.]
MKLKSVVLLFFFATIKLAYAQSAFTFFGTDIKPGTKHHFKIPISDDKDSTFIPITVFRGEEEGPVLGITAGVHGYEYPPILAGQRLIKSIDPKTLKGTVILVQIANVASFSGRSPFINPLDDKNLNRTFPGNSEGTVTEKIANFISENVISKSDYFLDMHAGDASEDLTSYSAFYKNSTMPEASQKAKEMAEALLFDYIIVFKTDGKDYVKKDKPSLYCSAEAFKRGIPAVDIECGGLGKSEKEKVLQVENGVLNMMNKLDMTVTNSEVIKKSTYQFVSNRVSQESNHDGIFYASKQSGDYVKQGMTLGVITDYFGNTLETLYAKANGVVLYIVGTPPINTGETLVTIGDIAEK